LRAATVRRVSVFEKRSESAVVVHLPTKHFKGRNMFNVHGSFKKVIFSAFVILSSFAGGVSASTPGQGPGQGGSIPPVPSGGWVMIYEGCGLCGLQGDQPDYTPYVPGIGSGDGSGGYVLLTTKGTYPSSSSETDAILTETSGIQYTNGIRMDYTVVVDKSSSRLISITAKLSVLTAGGTQTLATTAATVTGVTSNSEPYEIAFQNGYVIYLENTGGTAPVQLFRPVG
jgi:hypothetical protein